jgi:hypothetical protein
MPTDVFDAMQELEFEAFLPRLMAEVTKFTSIQADKRNSYRKKVREEKKANKGTGEAATTSVNGQSADVNSPPAKRARRSSVDNGEHATGSEEEGDGDDAGDDIPDEEDEAEDDDDEVEEDPIEVRDSEGEDDEMADGDESD